MQDAPSQRSETRQYRILDLIGKGGFGRVYRARLEGPEGFVKDVALKLLHADRAMPQDVIERFRDEARILGLVRDRAIVSVDPPTMLAGRWAVVMEFVDGASASRLCRLGPVPPGVVMEIGMEVARALNKIYLHPGLDGNPLHLIHRDVKPANVQITPSGEVKLLDFGIASADFESRESRPTMAIGGTRGYIAPERMLGFEGPEGDVFSLGALLTRLASGALAPENEVPWTPGCDKPKLEGDPLEVLLAYAHKMRATRPQDRPSAARVQRDLAKMRKRAEGETLVDWSQRVVPAASRLADDDMVGMVVTETLNDFARDDTSEDTGTLPVHIRQGVGAYLLGLTLVALGIVAGSAVLVSAIGPSSQEVPAPEPMVAAPVAAEPIAVKPPPPVVEALVLEPVPGTRFVGFSSAPQGAAVFVDGELLGATPLTEVALTEGVHEVRLVSGEASTTQTVRVGERRANRFVWKVPADQWQEGF